MGQDLFGTQYVQHQPNKYNNKNISISDAENFDKHTAKCALSFRDRSFKNNEAFRNRTILVTFCA